MRADRRVDLHSRAPRRAIRGGIEPKVMDAKLARRPISILLVVIDELETAGGGQVHDVGVSAGGSAQLEKVSRRGQLGGKGAAGGMGFDAALGSVPRASDA